jgi:hypothetical protein
MERGRRSRIACIIGLVLALHLACIWSLLANSRAIARRTDSDGLQIVLIAPSAPPERKAPGLEPAHGTPNRRASANRAPQQQPMPPAAEGNAIHAPIDWAEELSRAASDATAEKSAQVLKDFGFPHRPSPPPKATQFDWDYAATHRVQAVEGGGLLVNLNDRCVLVFLPVPLFACGVGTKEANGELLRHMGDPPAAERNSTP